VDTIWGSAKHLCVSHISVRIFWTSGGNRAKTYGFAQQENLRLSNNWILIFEMGFLVDFQPEIASEWTARKTHVF